VARRSNASPVITGASLNPAPSAAARRAYDRAAPPRVPRSPRALLGARAMGLKGDTSGCKAVFQTEFAAAFRCCPCPAAPPPFDDGGDPPEVNSATIDDDDDDRPGMVHRADPPRWPRSPPRAAVAARRGSAPRARDARRRIPTFAEARHERDENDGSERGSVWAINRTRARRNLSRACLFPRARPVRARRARARYSVEAVARVTLTRSSASQRRAREGLPSVVDAFVRGAVREP